MLLRRPRLALFLSGVFFGGALDHLLFVKLKSPTSHYGFAWSNRDSSRSQRWI